MLYNIYRHVPYAQFIQIKVRGHEIGRRPIVTFNPISEPELIEFTSSCVP